MVENSEEQKEMFINIAAAYNNRMRPQKAESAASECNTLRARFAEALAKINASLVKTNSLI